APDELVPGLVDAVLRRAGAGDEVGGVTVPHLPVVEDVGEAVPLGHALQRHDDPVVGAAVALHLGDVGRRPGPVAAVAEHRVNRVEALAGAALGSPALQRNAEREDLAGGGEAAGSGYRVGRDVVQRAELVVRSPPTPVPDLERERAEGVFAHGPASYGIVPWPRRTA